MVKLNKVFIILLVLFFGGILLWKAIAPSDYDWRKTFSYDSDQPFGCALFDSVMVHSAPHGYCVRSISSIGEWDVKKNGRATFLIMGDFFYFSDSTILSLVSQGNNVIIAGNRYSLDEFGVECSNDKYEYTNYGNLDADEVNVNCTFLWMDKNDSAKYNIREPFAGCYFDRVSSRYDVIAEREVRSDLESKSSYYYPEVVMCKEGNGRLVLVGTPYLFTNYAVRHEPMLSLSMRILSLGANHPIVRIDSNKFDDIVDFDDDSQSSEQENESSLRYLLSKPPLRWALYVSIVALLLGMFFTARRKQRVIPVVKPPVNHTMAMIEHIGSLYYHRNDHNDLLAKKYKYFTEELRRSVMVDIDDADRFEAEIELLAARTGMNKDEVRAAVTTVQSLLESDDKISAKQLSNAIDLMNDILSRI